MLELKTTQKCDFDWSSLLGGKSRVQRSGDEVCILDEDEEEAGKENGEYDEDEEEDNEDEEEIGKENDDDEVGKYAGDFTLCRYCL